MPILERVALGTYDGGPIYYVYESSNYGNTFSKSTNSVSAYPWSASCNVNCSSVLIGTNDGVYFSDSTGVQQLFIGGSWTVSPDSAVMAAVPFGVLNVKTPFTTGWETTSLSAYSIYAAAVSRNGNMIMAAEYNAKIWKCELPIPPPVTSTTTSMSTTTTPSSSSTPSTSTSTRTCIGNSTNTNPVVIFICVFVDVHSFIPVVIVV